MDGDEFLGLTRESRRLRRSLNLLIISKLLVSFERVSSFMTTAAHHTGRLRWSQRSIYPSI